ncbi:hypothetical protein S7711_11294 [Stachybotrys chartarum IBT 7711]|uniref:Uncharacterized protein n=1 Tax=Stachybotrys chartarum (strain CBS 109288 / IBT 7711) TaxID=1280523 RepID=A0A084BCL6_STACB|nr:hypothetical protein S7711_11294 [Stachybotrys chartarum IBT 7711]KFA71039.1 hypothetical protein S40288_11803 [Stachybotrys chartarum IBT 40288]
MSAYEEEAKILEVAKELGYIIHPKELAVGVCPTLEQFDRFLQEIKAKGVTDETLLLYSGIPTDFVILTYPGEQARPTIEEAGTVYGETEDVNGVNGVIPIMHVEDISGMGNENESEVEGHSGLANGRRD